MSPSQPFRGILGITVLLGTAGELNLFLLGEDQAASTGMRTARTRQILLAISAVVIAAGVCVTGVIRLRRPRGPASCTAPAGPRPPRAAARVRARGRGVPRARRRDRPHLLDPVTLQTGTVTALVGAPVLLALICRRSGR